MSAPNVIKDLVVKFRRNIDQYKSPSYNETETRVEFLNPFWKELGWDVDNTAGYALNYRDVIHEDAINLRGSADKNKKAPDYSFRIGGVRKFFLEAKKPAVTIKTDMAPAYQLRCYAWSCNLPVSVLSDFEEFAVYNCRVRPRHNDAAREARIKYMTYDEYVDRWDDIADVFHRESILRGSFDRFLDSNKSRSGTSEVDEEFLKEIEHWRQVLANDIARNNPDLSVRELNSMVQLTMNRIIFLRMAEDRGIEPEDKLATLIKSKGIYSGLLDFFKLADMRYNSGFFHFTQEAGNHEAPDTLSAHLVVSDRVLDEILKSLYPPKSPYKFDVFPVEVLGNVYERFLGNEIRLTEKRMAKVEQKPEVKKAGGVFYTPGYIVDYIVKNTVGKLCEGKTPDEVSRLRILDPACGSGSFLLGAYKFLLDWHLKYYVKNPPLSKKNVKGGEVIVQTTTGGWVLTMAEKKRILLNNIYGVDLDAQAVEVTKLSLSLAVLEGANKEMLDADLRIFYERALPNLASNIKCGNSLIASNFYDMQDTMEFSIDERLKINAFDWDDQTHGFGKILAEGGFDCVIGNPPYVRQEILGEPFKAYAAKHFKTFAGTADLYTYFIEKGINLLKKGGRYSIIVANKWLQANYGKALRRWLIQQGIREIIDFGDLPVFKTATAYPMILSVEKGYQSTSFEFANVDTLDFTSLAEHLEGKRAVVEKEFLEESGWKLAPRETQVLLRKIFATGKTLDEYVNGEVYYGIKTGLNEAFVITPETRAKLIDETPQCAELIKPFLAGREVKRYAPLTVSQYLIGTFPAKQYDIDDYPAIKKYLLGFGKARLEQSGKPGARAKTGYKWFETQTTIGYWESFEKPKIIFPDIALRMQATMDLESNYCSNTCYIIPKCDYYLLGILNSQLIQFVFSCISVSIRGGYYRFISQYVTRLPIRTIDHSNRLEVEKHDMIVKKVQEILDLNRLLPTIRNQREREVCERRVSALDRQIDALVYDLYSLTPDEIRLIEG